MTDRSAAKQEWLDILHRSGYKLTDARKAVVETICESERVLTPGEIYQKAVRRSPGMGLVTVYRTLEKLEALSLVQRVHMDEGCNSYVAAADGHQHLLICTSCNRAEYFSGDDLGPLIERLGAACGYQIEGHWLQLFGKCRQCQNGATEHTEGTEY